MSSHEATSSSDNASPSKPYPPTYTWEQKVNNVHYKLTTDNSLLDLNLFNKAFATKDVYWTNQMPEDAIKTMVDNSCVVGLYIVKNIRLEANRNILSPPAQHHDHIGFGRIITDYSTVAYITDVWISPEHQGAGLGKWMIKGIKEIIDRMPALRRAVLLTKVGGQGVNFYERELGMRVADPAKDAYGFMEYVPKR